MISIKYGFILIKKILKERDRLLALEKKKQAEMQEVVRIHFACLHSNSMLKKMCEHSFRFDALNRKEDFG